MGSRRRRTWRRRRRGVGGWRGRFGPRGCGRRAGSRPGSEARRRADAMWCAVSGVDLASNEPAPGAARAMGGDMEATTELVHQVVTVIDAGEYRAECSCGWASEWFLDDVEATEAGLEHPEIAV